VSTVGQASVGRQDDWVVEVSLLAPVGLAVASDRVPMPSSYTNS
jgi:hypothetical protein